jgi:hypothetical protein
MAFDYMSIIHVIFCLSLEFNCNLLPICSVEPAANSAGATIAYCLVGIPADGKYAYFRLRLSTANLMRKWNRRHQHQHMFL